MEITNMTRKNTESAISVKRDSIPRFIFFLSQIIFIYYILMKGYYEHFFPASTVLALIGPTKTRHFSIRWKSGHFKRYEKFKSEYETEIFKSYWNMDEHKQDGDLFKVYLKFSEERLFREYLVKHCPDSVNFQRNEKCPWPLIFDFDVAKDVVRPCSAVCVMCDICWISLVRQNLIKLYRFLTEIMEYRKVLVFYTGGRGFHIYVFDEKTRDYDEVTRYNIFYKAPVELDKEVFIKMSHQIRVPFSPHQDTGWVSRPVDDIEGFLPSMCKKYWEITQKDVEEWVEKCTKLI